VSSSSTSPQPTKALRPASRIAVFTHGHPARLGDALERAESYARSEGIEVVSAAEADLVIALGGDGTMLRALRATLGTGTPVFGINYGRVGFLTSAEGEDLEETLPRVLRGEYRVVDLCTLAVQAKESSHPAVNDVVVTSSRPGRMVELAWEIAGEMLETQPCDGMICCTPSGSTAYNFSNGGPVMMWGLEAMAITFVAPHSLHARPMVVPRSRDLEVTNETVDVPVAVIVDGHQVGELSEGDSMPVRLSEQRSLLATLPESTFFSRYRDTFAS
jgi:NAD+ kinase